jgi:predicted acylesterase/phospholipase RssA
MYDSIALGGGGSRGFVHVGALRALLEVKGDLEFPGGIYGQSIGSIVATAVAFRVPLDEIETMAKSCLRMSAVLPQPRLEHVTEFLTTKGMFPMDIFETHLIEVFRSVGIDLVGKKVADAPQTLYITASNVTTGKSCLLTGDVPLLAAIRCSCCIPFLFQPQVLFGQLFVDGASYSRSVRLIVPKETLVFQISGGQYNPTDFASYVQSILSGPSHQYKGETTLVFQNITVAPIEDPTEEDIRTMLQEGYSQARSWLAERILEKADQA